MSDLQMLIAGAGPTGLVLALWLNRLGSACASSTRRRNPGPRRAPWWSTHGRSSSTARSGSRRRWSIRDWRSRSQTCGSGAGRPPASASARWAQGLSPFPYLLIFPQDEHERLLIDRLGEDGDHGRAPDRAPRLRG